MAAKKLHLFREIENQCGAVQGPTEEERDLLTTGAERDVGRNKPLLPQVKLKIVESRFSIVER